MKKIFIEDSRVDSFMRDLNERLKRSLETSPNIERLVIMAIGESGVQVASRLYKVLGETFPRASAKDTGLVVVQKTSAGDEAPRAGAAESAGLSPMDAALVASVGTEQALDVAAAAFAEPAPQSPASESVSSDKEAKKPRKEHSDTFVAVLGMTGERKALEDFINDEGENTAYLILDGVCRSGQTLTSVYNHLRKKSRRVWSYSVAVSADAIFIPTWYGCMYEAHEFVLLTRNEVTQNTALYTSSSSSSAEERLETPALVLRPPLPDDPDFVTTEPSLERYKADDRFFDSKTRAKRILVLEWDSEPVGFIAFHVDGETLWVDYIIACQTHSKKRGIGTAMYYHVENYAKLQGCKQINLWAISTMVNWYEKRGFVTTSHKPISFGKEKPETYQQMSHSLVSETGHYHM